MRARLHISLRPHSSRGQVEEDPVSFEETIHLVRDRIPNKRLARDGDPAETERLQSDGFQRSVSRNRDRKRVDGRDPRAFLGEHEWQPLYYLEDLVFNGTEGHVIQMRLENPSRETACTGESYGVSSRHHLTAGWPLGPGRFT